MKAARSSSIGDYVDKGPESRQVIERLLSGVEAGWHLVALKGNHDAMMVEALRDPAKMAAWLGRAATRRWRPTAAIPPRFRQPTSHGSTTAADCMSTRIASTFTPASILRVPLDQQSEATLLWKRYPKEYC